MPVHGAIIPQHLIPGYEKEAASTHVIHKEADRYLEDMDEEERFMKQKTCSTFCACLSAMLGAFIVLLSTASTVAFQSQKKNVGLFVFGVILMSPLTCWFYFMFCPSKEERQRRRIMKRKRKERDKELDAQTRHQAFDRVEIKYGKEDEEILKDVQLVKGN